MSSTSRSYRVPRRAARKVWLLRWMVRVYVLLEGLAALAIVLGGAFWIGLGLDWLFEPRPPLRIALWIAVGAAAIWVLVTYVIDRLGTALRSDSLALLIERQYPELQESLVTSIQGPALAEGPHFQRELLDATGSEANAAVRHTSLFRIFNPRPLVRKGLLATALVGSILAFALLQSETFGFWVQRMQLAPQPWPRQVELAAPDFVDQSVRKVARDDQYELLIHASLEGSHTAPKQVEVRYRLADGRRGRDQMIQVGQALPGRDSVQVFRYTFENVSQDIEFDVAGGDGRIRNLRLQAVPRPAVSEMNLACIFPAYLQQGDSSLAVSGRIEVPVGTQAVCQLTSTKRLLGARAHDASTQEDLPVQLDASDSQRMSFSLGEISEDRIVMLTLHDEDRVENREPYRLVISAVTDMPPEVSVQLTGISTAVTPQARIPFRGQLTDDNGIQSAWYEYQVGAAMPERQAIGTVIEGFRKIDRFDLLDLAKTAADSEQRLIPLEPGQKLVLSLGAADAYDLEENPRTGSSQRFNLDVVTDSEMRAILERRELGLRQRFESIYEKMVGTRELLDRIQLSSEEDQSTDKDTTEGEAQDAKLASAARREERSRLRIVGAGQNATQLAFETLGVAEGFEAIVSELINNRIDTAELKNRLEGGIAEPLRTIGNELMPKLEVSLVELEADFKKSPTGAGHALARAKGHADETLEAMKQVLDRMLELENYNELIELLRTIVKDQEDVTKKTKSQQKNKLRRLLEE